MVKWSRPIRYLDFVVKNVTSHVLNKGLNYHVQWYQGYNPEQILGALYRETWVNNVFFEQSTILMQHINISIIIWTSKKGS